MLFDASGALSGPGSGFVAGILEHLPALMAFTAPTPNSYQRIAPGMWSSAYVSYGPDNREAAVRLASPVAGREAATANVELKPVDVTANPYLALAAVLAAGMDGMERALDPGEPTMVDPATLSEEERASRGIRLFPASLDEALDALEGDDALIEALGEPLVRTHLAVARAQAGIAREISPEEVAAAAAALLDGRQIFSRPGAAVEPPLELRASIDEGAGGGHRPPSCTRRGQPLPRNVACSELRGHRELAKSLHGVG